MLKYEDSVPALKRSLVSLRTQAYGRWECWIRGARDLPPLPDMGGRVRIGDQVAQGDYVIEIDAGDRLAPHALAWVAEVVSGHDPMPAVVYTDEDVADAQGQRGEPWFKPGWDPEYFLSRDFLTRSGYFRRDLLRRGSIPDQQSIADRLEELGGEHVRHIPAPLYHRGVRGERGTGSVRQFHVLQDPLPTVDLIVPTRDQPKLLRSCVESIRRKTDYRGYRIVVVDNDCSDPAALEYLEELRGMGQEVEVLRYPGEFNFAAINNMAAARSEAELIAFVNDDVEVTSPGWLRAMAELAIQPRVGAVGAHLLYPDLRIQHAGVFLGFRDYAGHLYKGLHLDAPDLMRRRDVVHQVRRGHGGLPRGGSEKIP